MSVADPVFPKLAALAGCLCAGVEEEELMPLCFCGMKAGTAASLDFIGNASCLDKGRDGMGWVSVETAFPTQNFPSPILTPHCGDYLTVNCVMGIVRTYPVNENGEPLDVKTELAVASRQVTEMLVMQKAITCCGVEVAGLNYTPIGPVGQAIGGMWRFALSGLDE